MSEGELYGALSKAQSEFPTITRDKEVDSRSYKFKYAPLDAIIASVRPVLAKHGLAFAQVIDGNDLVTMLLHESGGSIQGRAPIDHEGTIQQYGSAITYLRRYALQAILGIAAEEDDDGERAGARTPTRDTIQTAANTRPVDGSVIGTAEVGKADADFQLRQTPTGWKLAFTLTEGKTRIKVVALDSLAEMVNEYRAGIEGFRVSCWGPVQWKQEPKSGGGYYRWQELALTRLKVGTVDLNAPEEPADAA